MRASGVFFVRLAISVSKHFIPASLALALPFAATAATEVGAIPGSFAVSPTGAATYNIPINVPPGIAGMTPHLALTYNSQFGNGLAGYGWTLSGLSVITVCPRTLVDDGTPQIADFSGSGNGANKFCLDGARLTATSGNYGANGATYRKLIDDFSHIVSYTSGGNGAAPTSGPQYFTVQTPDGLTYEYGATTGTEIVASGPGVPSGVTVVRAWALDKIYDNFGNSVVFTYVQDTADGDFWPTSIAYATHNGTAGPNKIVFSYDDLTSINPGLVWSSYVAGAQVSQMKRLNEIDVNYNGVTTFAYTLAYNNTLTDSTGNNQGTERSLLKSVTECAGNTCYPATAINWQTGTSGWGQAFPAPMGNHSFTSTEASEMLMLDVNGDGQADLVYPGSSTGHWMVMLAAANGGGLTAPQDTGASADSNSQYAMPIDLQESGKQGLLVPKQVSGGTYDWFVLTPNVHSNGTVTFTSSDTGLQAIGYAGNATVFDLNGDGLPDIVYSDGTSVYWYKNRGDGTFLPALLVQSGAFSSSPDDVLPFQSKWGGSTANFDGTGAGGYMTLSELGQFPTWTISQGGDVTLNGSGNPVMSPSTGFGSISGDKGNIVVPMFIDFNGDGLSDVLYADTANGMWKVYFSSGNSINGGETTVGWDPSIMIDSLPVDYAGNGRQSALLPMKNVNNVCVTLGLVGYAGGVFHGDASLGTSSSNTGACASGYMYGSIRTADINGDGLQDLVWVANGTVYFAFHKGNYPDLVSSISNGFSQNYTISYGALSNGASYTAGSSPSASLPLGVTGWRSFPLIERSYTGPVYVVTNETSNNGIGSTFTDSFFYTGALINLVGRGFEGFGDLTVYDSRRHAASDSAGSLVDTTYNQSFPLTGTAATITSWTNTGTQNQGSIASFVNNTYLSVTTQGVSAQYVYLGTSIAKKYELGAGSTTSATPTSKVTTTTTPTISSAGVITSLDVQRAVYPASSTIATLTSDTQTMFAAGTSNWCLLLPSSVTVTNTDATGTQLSRSTSYVEDTAVNCRETSESATESNSGETLTKAFTYDAYGHVATVAVSGVTGGNSSARTTTYGYDSTNEFVASITNTLNEIANQTWNPALGVVLTATDPNGVGATFTYDSFGLKTKEVDGDGTYVIWCYGLHSGNCGISTSLTNAAYWVVPTHYSATNLAGASGTTIYDSFGRPLQSSGNLLGGTQTNVQTVYDKFGRVSATSTPYTGAAPTTWTYTVYDSFDRPTTVYSPAGQNSGCSASYLGETACATNYTYTGLTTSVQDPKLKGIIYLTPYPQRVEDAGDRPVLRRLGF